MAAAEAVAAGLGLAVYWRDLEAHAAESDVRCVPWRCLRWENNPVAIRHRFEASYKHRYNRLVDGFRPMFFEAMHVCAASKSPSLPPAIGPYSPFTG